MWVTGAATDVRKGAGREGAGAGAKESDVRSFSISYHEGPFMDTSVTSELPVTMASGDAGSSTDPGRMTAAAGFTGICVPYGDGGPSAHGGDDVDA